MTEDLAWLNPDTSSDESNLGRNHVHGYEASKVSLLAMIFVCETAQLWIHPAHMNSSDKLTRLCKYLAYHSGLSWSIPSQPPLPDMADEKLLCICQVFNRVRGTVDEWLVHPSIRWFLHIYKRMDRNMHWRTDLLLEHPSLYCTASFPGSHSPVVKVWERGEDIYYRAVSKISSVV